MQASVTLLRKLVRMLFTLWKRGVSGTVNLLYGLWKALRTFSTIQQRASDKNIAIDRVQQSEFFCSSSTPTTSKPVIYGLALSDKREEVLEGTDTTSNPGCAGQHIFSNSSQTDPFSTNGGSANLARQTSQVQGSLPPTVNAVPYSGEASEAAPTLSSSTHANAGNTNDITLETIRPSDLERYDRNLEVPAKEPAWEIEKLVESHTFRRKQPQDAGWTSCAHPEGLLYHRGEVDGTVYYTDADVSKPAMLGQVKRVIKKIQEAIDMENQTGKTSIKVLEVALEAKDSEKGIWGYYIVDHETQHLFWLGNYTLETYIYKGAESVAHIGQLLKIEYYTHLSYFPHQQRLDDAFFSELRGILVWNLTDSLTSLDSLAPYDVKTMENFLKLINHMQDLSKDSPEYSVAAGARLRLVFETSKFDNFSGLPCARLTRSQSVRVPTMYLKSLDGLYMDNVVFQAPFRTFVGDTSSGWQQDVINAAVLFTANIAFLAIPTLLPDTGEMNAAATASFVSIIFSLSSIIFGQLLSKKIQVLSEEQTYDVASYFSEWWSTQSGLSELAIMYSLPYALMIWGAIAFILSIFLFAFRNFKINAHTLVIIFFLATSMLLCVWIVFEISGWAKVKDALGKPLVKLGITTERADPERRPNMVRRKPLTFGDIVNVLKVSMNAFKSVGRGRATTSRSRDLDRAEAQAQAPPEGV